MPIVRFHGLLFSRGRPHPAYLYGGAALLAVKLLNWPIKHDACLAFDRERDPGAGSVAAAGPPRLMTRPF
jgi:hypothetical protein